MVAGEAVQAGRRRHWHGRPPDRLGRRRQRRRCRRLGPAGSAGTGPTRPQRRLGRCGCCFGRADRLVPAGAGGNGADRVAGLGSVLLWFAVFVPRRRRRACEARGRPGPAPSVGLAGLVPLAAAAVAVRGRQGRPGGSGWDRLDRWWWRGCRRPAGGVQRQFLRRWRRNRCAAMLQHCARQGASAPPWARASRLSTECLWECFVVWDRC